MNEAERKMYDDMKAKERERENDVHFFKGFCIGALFATLSWWDVELVLKRFGM